MQNKRRNILVVDDDKSSRLLLYHVLRDRNYNVIFAENGKEGLEKALTNDIDFMIIDYNMPIMDGSTMVSKLKENPLKKDIPFIMISACKKEYVLEEATKLGNAYFLQKPDYKYQDIPSMIENEFAMEKLKCRMR